MGCTEGSTRACILVGIPFALSISVWLVSTFSLLNWIWPKRQRRSVVSFWSLTSTSDWPGCFVSILFADRSSPSWRKFASLKSARVFARRFMHRIYVLCECLHFQHPSCIGAPKGTFHQSYEFLSYIRLVWVLRCYPELLTPVAVHQTLQFRTKNCSSSSLTGICGLSS